MTQSLADTAFQCPKCGGNGCTTQAWPDLTMIFVFLNPALIINEILLGQRIPRTIYFCIRCEEPMVSRQYVSCPKCGKFHPGLIWADSNAFGHWFGLFCPDCGARIPTHMSLFSIAIAALMAPIWWPIWRAVKPTWIEWEKRRAHARQSLIGNVPNVNWIRRGALGFGLSMWACMSLYIVIFKSLGTLEAIIMILIMLPIWVAGGALFGLFMRRIMMKHHTFQPGHCRSCGYNLRDLTSAICPECGFRFDKHDQTG